MKKILSIILAFIMILNIGVLAASATGLDATVTISDVIAHPGDKIEVFIGVEGAGGIKTLTFYDFDYDNTFLSIVEDECAWLISGKIKDIDFQNDASIITFDDNTAHSGNILKLVFLVSESAEPGEYSISCKTKMTRMINGYETKLTVPDASGMLIISWLSEGLKVSGNVISFLNDTDMTVLTLASENNSAVSYSSKVTGNSTEFSFENVEKGDYILSVSKENHVTRTYKVTVIDEDITQDVKIHVIGDINGDGKVNTMDVARANASAKGVNALADYGFACADVNGDGKVNTMDVARINAHAKGVTSLW